LSEARELYQLMQAIEVAQNRVENKSKNLKTMTYSMYELYYLTRRLMAAFKRLGLPEQAEQTIATLQRLIMMMHTLYVALNLIGTSTEGIVLLKIGVGLMSALGMAVQEQSRSFG